MATDADPYRTLGLSRDATLEEVRRAYRRLAKANHPDAAGEAALPRFLAIQAAYDTIAGPDARGRRPGAARSTGPRRAWDADRERTDATYRAYGGRGRRARPTGGPGGAAGAGGAGGPGGTGAAGGLGGARGPSGDRPPGTGRPPHPDRPPNKATLGSTSYDGAEAEPFEPDWGGASWYGTTSGTYWTLNPKEYADPRKHGPEYQARARRKLRGRQEAEGLEGASTSRHGEAPPPDTGTAAAGPPPDAGPTQAAPPPSHTTSSWWEATAGHPPRTAGTMPGQQRPGERRPDRDRAAASGRAGDRTEPAPDRARATTPHPAPVTMADPPSAVLGGDALLDAVRAWLDDTRPGAVGRVARAVLGWAPIALGIGWLSGEISGCGRFAATCDDAATVSAWVAQIAVLLLLLAVGRLARIASVATLATLAAAVPATLLLTATGSPNDAAAGRIALSGLLAIAWVVGLGFGTVREVRGSGRRRAPPGESGPAGPVS